METRLIDKSLGSAIAFDSHPNPFLILQRQYFSLYPAYLLAIPKPLLIASPEGQSFLIQCLLGQREQKDENRLEDHVDDWAARFQPETEYQIKAWKRIMNAIEEGISDDEGECGREWLVDDRLYDHITNLMVSSTTRSEGPQTSFRTFLYDTSCPEDYGRITLLEEQIAIQDGTTGLRTWTAALHLGHHILGNFSSLFPKSCHQKQRFIELGAGSGFVSILLSQLGYSVLATDLGGNSEGDEGELRRPLERLRSNIDLNEYANTKPTSQHLDWNDAFKVSDNSAQGLWQEMIGSKSTIVAADVIYDPSLVSLLVETIDVLLGCPKDELSAIIAATLRNQDTFDLFLHTCENHALKVENIKLKPMDPVTPTFWESTLDASVAVVFVRVTKPFASR
ncbi:uncharacterized protein L203_103482 [Cryptococcus depauperatus CBS 7841]|uniref:Uncharacterized protein n=1 Tax=Cryptococcus depauperatus CBS 7841 TaxID=1295531 RepID=A0A1E3IKS8_9TREE|nr:hypothetical protein L203_02922 [Cryptococcus depauperatus CBS 7841]